MVRTISPYFMDLAERLLKQTIDHWKVQGSNTKVSLVDKDKQTRYLKYIIELTKFGISHPNNILNIMHKSMQDFTGNNIETIIMIMDQCGPYLMRNVESRFRFHELIKRLETLMNSKSITQNLQFQFKNALLLIFPPKMARLKDHK